MPFLRNPHLDLTTSRIETARCMLVPFSTDGRVDIRELQEEFCLANKNFWVAPILPDYDAEYEYVRSSEIKMQKWEEFENFILDKRTQELIWAGGIRVLESGKLNIGIWIREREHGKWYATEIYTALLDWARQNTDHTFLKHSLNPVNIASRKLAERFGGILQEEKTDRGHDIYHIPLYFTFL
jgi:RimJ/RimL family protein N-acetyltransferase